MTISRWILLSMRIFSNKSCTENHYTHLMFSDIFPKIVPFMRCWKIRWNQRAQTIWRLCVAYWIRKPTHAQAHARARALTHIHGRTQAYACPQQPARGHGHTRTEICNTYCFPRQQWFREHASMLRYTYIALLFILHVKCPYTGCSTVSLRR